MSDFILIVKLPDDGKCNYCYGVESTCNGKFRCKKTGSRIPRKIFDWIRPSDCPLIPVDRVSDGYHTFRDLYDQRAALFSVICRTYSNRAWKSKLHHDGTMFDGGYFIVGIETPDGQYTYHYKMDRWDLYPVKELPNAPEWDGHTDADVGRLYSILLDELGLEETDGV